MNLTGGSALSSISNNHRVRFGRSGSAVGRGTAGLLLPLLLALGALPAPIAHAAEPVQEQTAPAPQLPDPRQPLPRITGNEHLSTATLLKAAAEELRAYRSEGFRNTDADDAAYRMEVAYRQLGYRFATVDFSQEHTPERGTSLLFTVQEGPRVRLGEIILTGNTRVPTATLQPFLAAQTAAGSGWFDESRINAAIEAIQTYYATNGYLQAVVGAPQYTFSPDKTTVTVQVAIAEGTSAVIQELNFSGDLLPEVTGELNELRKLLLDHPYVPRQSTYLLESRITARYGDLGYPDARVEVQHREEGPGSDAQSPPGNEPAALEVRITSGPRVTISAIRISGNVKTSSEFILSRLQLATGEIYSAAKERASFSGLYRTGLFSLVRLSLVATEVAANRQLLVELTELPARELSFELGWGSYEMLRGKIEVRNKNFTGRGRVLSGSVAASLKSTDLSLGLSDPWLLGRDLVLDLPLYYRTRTEPSFDRTETGISTVVSKHFTDARVGVSLAYLLRRTQQSDLAVTAQEAGNDYNFASLKVQTSRDTRDDLFFPATGYRSLVALELTDRTLGSSLAFIRFTTTNRFFFTLAPRTVLAARYDTGFVVPTTEDLTLPLAERFFNGGASSVRSFRESELGPKDQITGAPLGGSAYNLISLELRQRFQHNLGASIFLDYGNISPSNAGGVDQYSNRSDFISATFQDYFSGFRPALGIGLQYILPVGPIRLDGAWNPAVDKEQRENAFTVHLTVGMAF